MATRIAWLLNLDADRELHDQVGYRVSRIDAARVAELRASIADLIAADDIVLGDDTDAATLAATGTAFTIQAFCPTPSALARIEALGLPVPHAPALSVLRAVNDRSFCAQLGHGLAGSCFARDMLTLEAHLKHPSPTGIHVIKRAFSFAGREQRRVTHGVLDDSTRGFCERSFAHGEGLQVEPWVERMADFCRHGFLTRQGALLIGAAREQRCDAFGRFLGMSTTPAQLTSDEDALLRDALVQTGSALFAAGYCGPFGIDAFRYRHVDGGTAFNPRCEINARFTMGYPRDLLNDGLAGDPIGFAEPVPNQLEPVL